MTNNNWQIIASGEVKGKYQVYIGDKSIYNIENKLIDYNGKNIEIAVRVKDSKEKLNKTRKKD